MERKRLDAPAPVRKRATSKPTGQRRRPMTDKDRETLSAKGFKPGHEKRGGRKPGSLNLVTKLIKEGMMGGISDAGYFKKDDNPLYDQWQGGQAGYYMCLCVHYPEHATRLIAMMLPVELTGKHGSATQLVYTTREEVRQRMKELGMPIPPALSELPAYAQHPNQVQAAHPTKQ